MQETGRPMRDVFKAGDRAEFSGIYKVNHGKNHAEAHEVTAIYGDIFPSCLECLSAVQFELKTSAVHVSAHHNFNRSR
jgi:hypothetical protein